MKHIAVLLFLLLSLFVRAQQLAVSDFYLDAKDLTAINEATKVLDDNGDVSALIRIETLQKGFAFDAGTIGIVKADESKVGEIWLYVPAGLARITIRHPQLGTLRDYYFPERLQSGRTYVMKLVSGYADIVITPKATSQFLVVSYYPLDAMVEIDGVVEDGVDGIIAKKLSLGKHEYRVRASNYHTEVGSITIAGEKVYLNVSLRPAFGWIEVNEPEGAVVYVDNNKIGEAPVKSQPIPSGMHDLKVSKRLYQQYQDKVLVTDSNVTVVNPKLVENFVAVRLSVLNDAEIWVNEEQKGNGSVLVNLEPGEYVFETRKRGHKSQAIVRDIDLSSSISIDLPAPVPVCGLLEVNVAQIGARVYVDGKYVGDSPLILDNVLVGKHEVTITSNGYKDRKEQIEITENQSAEITGSLVAAKQENDKVASESNPKYEYNHFECQIDFNSNFRSGHGGLGADLIMGLRYSSYYFIGAGLGLHSLMNAKNNDNNLFGTFSVNNTFYIPTDWLLPMFDFALGLDVGALGIKQSYSRTSLGLYAKAGFGFEGVVLRMSVGYEYVGTHTGYFKIGVALW